MPIHHVCRYSTPEIIKYTLDIYIEKGLNLECKTAKDGYVPIHIICQCSTHEMIKYILDIYIEKGLNLECKTSNGYTPIKIINEYSTPETKMYISKIYNDIGLNYTIERKIDEMYNHISNFVFCKQNRYVEITNNEIELVKKSCVQN